jgi:hypothetical protein
MELTKKHREAFLSELQKAKEDKRLQELCLQDNKEDLAQWFETSIFLAQKRIELIEQSLINNEIDF